MKEDIKATSKANSNPIMQSDNAELVKENEKLRKELHSLNNTNSKLESIIQNLKSDKASLIASLRILQEDSGEISDAEPAKCGGNHHSAEQPSKTKKPRKAKRNRTNASKSSLSNENKVEDSDNNEVPNQRKRVVILGDSTVKGLKWWKMSSNKNGPRVNVHSFPGCTIEDMESYVLPTIRKDPDEIILHVGTNDLKSQPNPQRLAEQVINLADNITQNCKSKVTISGLLPRTDDKNLSVKVPKVNKILKTFASNRGWSYIDHTNIDQNSLNLSGLHLNQQGSTNLSKNFLTYINESY